MESTPVMTREERADDYSRLSLEYTRLHEEWRRLQRKPIANAKLISAAPDMLEALQNLENDNNSIPKHAWDLVQNAIQKAIK